MLTPVPRIAPLALHHQRSLRGEKGKMYVMEYGGGSVVVEDGGDGGNGCDTCTASPAPSAGEKNGNLVMEREKTEIASWSVVKRKGNILMECGRKDISPWSE